MVEGDRHVGPAGVLHRRGGRAAVAVSVSVAVGVPEQQCELVRLLPSRPRQLARSSALCTQGSRLFAAVDSLAVQVPVVGSRRW